MISPIALFCLRAIGALLLFTVFSLITGNHEKIERRDLWKVALASFLGLFLTQMSFLKATTMATAIDLSILSILSPIMTMIVAAIVIKDKITAYGILGLSISVAGVLFLILNNAGADSPVGHTSVWGVLLMIVNTLSFALYVGIFKPLIQKYSVVCFMKWMFLFSTIFALPFGFKDMIDIDYAALPPVVVGQTLYVIIFATFVAYFLIPLGQKLVKPVVVCMYSYVQPVIAMILSLASGMDHLTWGKALASILVFVGVGIVNFVPKKNEIRL